MRPSGYALALLGVWLVIAVGAAWFESMVAVWVWLGFAIGIVLLMDGVRVWDEPRLEISRDVPHNLPVEAWATVSLVVNHRGRRPYHLALFDHVPAEADTEDLPQSIRLAPGEYAALQYRLRPRRRGNGRFAGCEARVLSPWGLWWRQRLLAPAADVKIFPNFAPLARYALLATENHCSQIGIKSRRRRGEGMSFQQLREYREGDTLRNIDWNATSRMHKLISREYEDERDQQIVFLLDCGRRMRVEDHGLNHLDQALTALLLLSFVALRQGDAVGLQTFAGPPRWLSPQKGRATIKRLLSQLYDLHATGQCSDFVAAADTLMRRQHRRALVVVVSNLRDEDAEGVEQALRTLRHRHVVVFASLGEPVIYEVQQQPVTNVEHALAYCAASEYSSARQALCRKLRAGGAHVLDVAARELPVALVNQYWDIKRAGAL